MRCTYKRCSISAMVILSMWIYIYCQKNTNNSVREKSLAFISFSRRGNNKLFSEDRPRRMLSNRTLQVLESLPWSVNRTKYLPNFYTQLNANSGVGDYRESTIVYLHHNKAAGTSTKECLITTAKATKRKIGTLLSSHGRTFLEHSKYQQPHRLQADIFMGGYASGVCDHISDKPCSYFTILRDPYERLISSYSYCRRARQDQICSALGANDVSITEWAQHQGSFFFQQLLFDPVFCSRKFVGNSRLSSLKGIQHDILGRSKRLNTAPCWFRQKVVMYNALNETQLNALLDYCLANLENWFSVIGLVEEFDTSLALLEDVYNLPFTKCATGTAINKNDYMNLDIKTILTEKNAEETVAYLKRQLHNDAHAKEALEFDIKLYQKAKEIFAKQKKAYEHMFRPGNI